MRTRLLMSAGVAVVLGLALVGPAVPASAKGLSQSQINAIEKQLHHGKSVTFLATYTAVNGGQKQTITIAQAPPKSYFGTTDGAMIDTGKTTYYCSTAESSGNTGSSGNSGTTGTTGNSGSTTTTAKAGQLVCIKGAGGSGLLGIEGLFSPAAALAVLNEAKAGSIASRFGVHLTSSTGTYAGQPATCFSGTALGKSGKYCVTNQGILAYVTTGSRKNNYFELTKYTSKPPSSLFGVPAGATTETTPSAP